MTDETENQKAGVEIAAAAGSALPEAEITRLTDEMRHFQFVAQMAEREGERLGTAVDRILRHR